MAKWMLFLHYFIPPFILNCPILSTNFKFILNLEKPIKLPPSKNIAILYRKFHRLLAHIVRLLPNQSSPKLAAWLVSRVLFKSLKEAKFSATSSSSSPSPFISSSSSSLPSGNHHQEEDLSFLLSPEFEQFFLRPNSATDSSLGGPYHQGGSGGTINTNRIASSNTVDPRAIDHRSPFYGGAGSRGMSGDDMDNGQPRVGSLEKLISESYKFIRMADDLHNVANYLSEMRMCFLLLTGTVYIILAIYFVTWCIRRNRRRVNNPSGTGAGGNRRLPNQRWGELQGNDYENALTAQTNVGQTEDLVSVRSDGALPPGKVQPAGIGTGASQFGMAGRAANRQAAPTFMRHSAAASTMQNHSAGTGGGGGGSTGGGGATTRLMADVDTGTAMMVSTAAAAAAAKQQQQSSPHLGGVHHHHHHPTAVAHLQHSPHSAEQQQQTLGQSAGRSPACLLNNIAEEKESSGGSNSGSSSTAGTMSTFGWRNKEKVLLERHELQTMSDNV